ncbi:ATP-binding protein [Geomonas sp. RF6]|uniref:ATP-binding protein n=1 Tax=Geomonas sp. RF6 TaxID=2897342 RepID=UPI001E5EB208|nr:ATP-binding protein [Geomonas sp. RF6]UFS71019.1 ATP-binding protein [Geomonas sp. RF6]
MKIMIKYRLFLAILAATTAVVVSMYLIMQWSFSQGFLSYINKVEAERLDKLAELLEDSFQKQGNWSTLERDPGAWQLLLTESLRRDGGDQESERDRRRPPEDGKPAPPSRHASRMGNRFEARVLLLDAQRHKVAGAPAPTQPAGEQPTYRAITSAGKAVGYIGVLPRKHLTDTRQLRFLKEQKVAMGMIAGVMFLVSAAISLPLANNLVRPIKDLALSIHALASGRFDTRVAVSSADELGQLGKDFNALALSLEKNEQARRQWVADISHELRTPLSVLRGEIEAIQDGVREATPESIRSLHMEVMHLSRLVDDLYQLSLFDVGALTYRKRDLDLAEVLRHAVESFRGEFEQKKIDLDAQLSAASRFPVYADEQRLLQLFDNLLDNALKYTDPGGVLAVRMTRQEGRAVIDFQDSAPGVEPSELGRLFDRLFRVESSRNRALGGAGLGLSICKNIVEAHEGTIEAHAAPQGGVWIKVELPMTGGRA